MFEASLVESSGALESRSGRYVWITGTLNGVIVAVMILIPLLYPEALPRTAKGGMFLASPPLPPAQPPTAAAARSTRVIAPMDAYTAPSSIPHLIATTHEDPPPAGLDDSVPGMKDMGRNSLGTAGGINPSIAPAVVNVVPPKAIAPVHISSGVVAGNKLSGSTPVYSPIARAAHVSGAVVLHAVISRAGSIQSLMVVSGPEMLRANAVAAVQDWKYRPYLLNGEPTEVETTITVNFSFGG